MISANYPIIGTTDFVSVSIFQPHRNTDSGQEESVCKWIITAPNFEKSGSTYGIDDLQAVFLALKLIDVMIKQYETANGVKCGFTFVHSA